MRLGYGSWAQLKAKIAKTHAAEKKLGLVGDDCATYDRAFARDLEKPPDHKPCRWVHHFT